MILLSNMTKFDQMIELRIFVPCLNCVETPKSVSYLNKAAYGNKQQSLIFQSNILREECEKNKTMPEKGRLLEEFVYQLVISEQTVQHCDELLKAHTGDSECELVKALKENNVDISAYQSGSISSWQPLHAHGGQRRQSIGCCDEKNLT